MAVINDGYGNSQWLIVIHDGYNYQHGHDY